MYIFNPHQGAPPKSFWCTPPAGIDIHLDLWRNLTAPCQPLNYSALTQITGELADYQCDSYQFEGGSRATVVNEWNLVCDREQLVSVTETSFLVGTALGSLCSGWVSDKFGRRHTLMVLAATQAVFGKYIRREYSFVGIIIWLFGN